MACPTSESLWYIYNLYTGEAIKHLEKPCDRPCNTLMQLQGLSFICWQVYAASEFFCHKKSLGFQIGLSRYLFLASMD